MTGQELRRMREEKGIGTRELSRRSGVSMASISNFETGKRGLGEQSLVKVLSALGCNHADCNANTFSPVPVPRRIPVVGMAAAAMYDPALSQICDLWEGSEETVPCVLEREGIFAIRIQGDSMEPALHDGDVVAVDPNELPKTGDTAVVCLREDGLVIKRWFWRHGVIRLESLNTEGRTFEWTKNEVFQKGIILWRWKVLGILWRKL